MTRVHTKGAVIGVRPEAQGHWLALVASLASLEDAGRTVVCAADPGPWFSTRAADRAEAAQACAWCPVRRQCLAYATANDERSGVWGGRDFYTPQRKKDAA